MSDTNIVKNWSYPFKSAGESIKEVTDPQVYFDALAKAENGFYPMGKNGLWHGGVHFDDNTAALLDQSSIRCIADGEVIAYRIDQAYPETQYGSTYTPGAGPEAVTAKYSTGFVLVKHLLELPPAPPPPSASGATTTPSTGAAPAESSAEAAPAPTSSEPAAEPERLTFYSLYMHLLDWTSYEANPALQRPAFWGAGLCKVKPDAPDKVRGLNVREYYKVGESNEHYAQYQNKLTTLPRGTRIETGEAAPSPNHNWRRLIRATPAVEGLAENTGWVYVLQAKELAENQYLVSEDESKDLPATEQIGLHVRESASGSSNVLAVLPRGTEIQVSGEGNFVKLEAIVSGNAIPPLTADAEGRLPGYVWLQSLEAQRSPNDLAKDKVYPLPTAQRIKAGELVGHMGLYQEYDQEAPKSRLHLEVFSCEGVPAFIEKSKARAALLPDDQKTLLMVGKDSKIIQPTSADIQIAADHDVRAATDSPTEGCWAKVHPYVVLKAKKVSLGSFDGTHNRYPIDATKKNELAEEFDLDVSELPDAVDFLLESYKEDGSDMYPGKTNIPNTHVRRKIGVKLNTPAWVKRSALNAQGRRVSTSGTLTAWKNFPLSQATNGQACGFERIFSKASWSDLSVDHKAIDANAQKTRWWYVTVANSDGQDISGWVPEADLIVTLHSPWEWPGFSYIEDATTLLSQQAQTLNAQGVLSAEEAQTYTARIDEAEHGPIFQRLFKIIDQPNDEGIRDKELTSLEIKKALEKPWLAQQLSLLITHYESEWFWKDTKWNELDSLMASPPEQANADWEKEKQRIKNLSWWSELAEKHGITAAGQAWHINPSSIIRNFKRLNTSICGCQLGKIFTCVRYTGSTTQYGPQYKGSISLESYENWNLAISNEVVTEEEKSIFIAMSPNEGNLDSIQSYDSEIVTAGAMQKTINPAGSGEFPMQVFDFQEKHPNLYEDLFVKCGWTVQGPRHTAKMYYSDSDLTSGNPITGGDLKSLIREGYSQSTQGSKCESKPLAAILTAIKSTEFIEQQVFDFSRRMKSVLEIKPAGYEFKLRDILKSALGKATALDHHINRPGYVDDDLGASLDRFFESNPSAPTDISTWGSSHENYESELLDDYGNTRRMAMQNGISVAPARYEHLKDKLQ